MYSTAVGYAGGSTPHPTYHETCGGSTGHAEVVQVVYDPSVISTAAILNEFWSDHRPLVRLPPTNGNDNEDHVHVEAARNSADHQYRSIVLATSDEQLQLALDRRAALDANLTDRDSRIATQIRMLDEFYYAEDYHQQYSAKRQQRYTRPEML